jgi:hypothetical protein
MQAPRESRDSGSVEVVSRVATRRAAWNAGSVTAADDAITNIAVHSWPGRDAPRPLFKTSALSARRLATHSSQ